MPAMCSAFGCKNQRGIESKSQGITFHKFPKNTELKKQWEVALRRDGFVASDSAKLCSGHFLPEDFDRTGQTVRLRDGVTPSVFKFSSNLKNKKPVATRTTKTSMKAEQSLPIDLSVHIPESKPQLNDDHSYAMPSSPSYLKVKLSKALDRVESLEREKLSAKARERRAKKAVMSLLEDLKKKTLINKELKEKLDFQLALKAKAEMAKLKPHSCLNCGKGFSKKFNLQRHKCAHTGKKTYTCKECGRNFGINGSLKKHQCIHTSEKPYSCSQCGKRFSKTESLVKHQRIHTRKKPYCCTECGKSFTQQMKLEQHQRFHTGEKPYSCSDCGKRFRIEGNLMKHQSIHMEDTIELIVL